MRTRKQNHTVETVRPIMLYLRPQFPKAGIREVISLLFHEWDMSVSRFVAIPQYPYTLSSWLVVSATMQAYFTQYEAHLILVRRAGRLKRKQFWAAGCNDIWAVDQHDKWKYLFGLALHLGLDPFTGRFLWLEIWWTNSNPRLILSYYLDAVEREGGTYHLFRL